MTDFKDKLNSNRLEKLKKVKKFLNRLRKDEPFYDMGFTQTEEEEEHMKIFKQLDKLMDELVKSA